MERIYLYVPPEEYAEVKASGACWDDHSKRWYVDQESVPAALSRWLGDGEDSSLDPEFGITSDEAFVASTQTVCVNCHERIEVITYGETGTDAAGRASEGEWGLWFWGLRGASGDGHAYVLDYEDYH